MIISFFIILSGAEELTYTFWYGHINYVNFSKLSGTPIKDLVYNSLPAEARGYRLGFGGELEQSNGVLTSIPMMWKTD